MAKKIGVLMLLVCIVFGGDALAGFPEKSIVYSVTFGPGGLSDRTARYQQQKLEDILGEKIVVQYKPGGGGSVGWSELSRAKKDGYFMATINVPHIILQPLSRGNAGFETRDLLPVALFQDTPVGLSVLKDSKFKSLDELVAYARKNPGKLTVAGSGKFTGDHLTHLAFEKEYGVKMIYIPYATGMKSLNGFLGRHTMAGWQSSSTMVMKENAVRPLAVAADRRLERFPGVPTFRELGHDIESSISRGVAVPAGTPPEVVQALEDAFRKVCTAEAYKAFFAREGYVNIFYGSERSQAYIKEKQQVFKKVLAEAKGQ